MDCIVDFCVGCDKTAVDGFYCSETCRLADLEKASASSYANSPSHTPLDPFYTIHFGTISFQPQSKYPPPPTKTPSLADLSSEAAASLNCRHRHPSKHHSHVSPYRDLSPASRRYSGNTTPQSESSSEEETHRELMSYFNAFDKVRELRRKSVPGTRLPQPKERRRQNSH